jgi:hypothetical protein
MATTTALGEKPYQLVPINDLTGGVDLRHSPTLIQPERSRFLRNVSLQEPGAWQPFPGWQTRSNGSIWAGRIQGARRIYLVTGTFMLASVNGVVFKPADTGVWGAAIIGGRSTTNEHFYVYDRTLVALFDGQAAPIKSKDGTTWTVMGIVAPAAPPTLALVAGGTLVAGNTYEVAYTYGDSTLNFESSGATVASIAPSAGNLTIRVTMAVSADTQVTTKYIYCRNVTAGESVLRRAGSVPNATTTFDITTPGSFFPDGVELPTKNTPPGAFSFGVVWRNRWWARDATVTNRIWFSEIFLPQAWPGLYYLDIPFDRGDRITALIALGDTLIVFGNTGVYLIIGQTSLDFEVRPSAGAVAGALGPRAVYQIEAGVLHCSDGGLYLFDGATDSLLSDDIWTAWSDMMQHTTPAEIQKIPVVYHPTRKEVRIAVPRLYDISTPGEWVLDLSRTKIAEGTSAWTSTTRAIGGYIPWDGREVSLGDQQRLWSWKYDVGMLAEESLPGAGEDGAPMTSYYEGPALLPAARRWSRFIEVFGEYRPTAGTFTVEVLVDDSLVATLPIDITSGGLSLYSLAILGTDVYSGKQRRYFTSMLPLKAEGMACTVRCTYVGLGLFKLFTYALGVRPEPQLRGFN